MARFREVMEWVWFTRISPIIVRIFAVLFTLVSVLVVLGEATLFTDVPVGLVPLMFDSSHGLVGT